MKNHTIANLFMLFLLTFNIAIAIILGRLYHGVLQGTQMTGWVNTPWFLVANQLMGLLLPLVVFKGLLKMVQADYGIYDEDALTGSNTDAKLPLGVVNVIFIVAISLFIQPFMMLVAAIASLMFPNPVVDALTGAGLLYMPLPVSLLVIAVTPAVCEELVFRGFIQQKYAQQPMIITAIVNGLFFGIIHLNLHQFTYAFLMGIVFVYMVHITKTVWAAVISHFVINASQFSLMYWAQQNVYMLEQMEQIEAYYYALPENAEMVMAIVALGMIAIFTMPVVGTVFYFFVKHNEERNKTDGKVEDNTEDVIPEEKPGHPFDMAFFAVVLVFVGLMLVL